MSIKNLLLWEKYRPKSLEDIILPERIVERFKNGVTKNYIFYSKPGRGKTTLARILIGKYTKDKNYIEINASLDTSIEILRNKIENFCRTIPMLESDDPIKYVFLDEAEKMSSALQQGLKAFIEHYHQNVRFILTTNDYSKIFEGLISRFTSVNFDDYDQEEEKQNKIHIYNKIMKDIAPKEDIKITKEELISIITKKYPDIRSIINELQDFKEVGHISTGHSNINSKLKLETYNIIYDNSVNYEKIYHFLMSMYGAENIGLLFNILGNDFIEYSLKENKNVEKLFECNYVISDYRNKLDSQTDPIILGMTIIGKFRDILI